MISVDELDRTILELEQRDTTYATCEKLAWLYIVRDHLLGTTNEVKTAQNDLVPETDGSEFLIACTNKSITNVLQVINEHMEAVAAVFPKEYDSVILRLKNL